VLGRTVEAAKWTPSLVQYDFLLSSVIVDVLLDCRTHLQFLASSFPVI